MDTSVFDASMNITMNLRTQDGLKLFACAFLPMRSGSSGSVAARSS
jgi:hypothetical protein